jgi:hypothetical protein
MLNEVLLIRGNSGHELVWPADSLKFGRDLTGIQAGIIAAVAADDLEHVGVAAFHVARNDAGRPASQYHRPVNSWMAEDCHRACLS